jgi:hypothetical protein
MKKVLAAALLGAMLLGGMVPAAQAAPPRTLGVVLDGHKVSFPDVQPCLDANQQPMVPVKFLADRLGVKVAWEASTETVTLTWQGKELRLRVGQTAPATLDLEDPALTRVVKIGERVFVPLPFVQEFLGIQVQNNVRGQMVTISTRATAGTQGQYDMYGRKIRTTNLPKNYQEYPYILEDIPNEMYELPRLPGFTDASILSPAQVSRAPEYTKKNVDLWTARVRNYLTNLLNVDYRTVDESLVTDLMRYRGTYHVEYSILNWVKWARQNEIQVEGYAEPEPSMIYGSDDGGHIRVVRTRVAFRFLHFKQPKDLLWSVEFTNPSVDKIKPGVWYETYVDVPLQPRIGTPNWAAHLYFQDWVHWHAMDFSRHLRVREASR